MHFGVAPAAGCCTLSALALKWAVTQWLKVPRLVKHCLGDRFHVKIPPQKLSVQRGEPISPHCNDLRKARFVCLLKGSPGERVSQQEKGVTLGWVFSCPNSASTVSSYFLLSPVFIKIIISTFDFNFFLQNSKLFGFWLNQLATLA